MKTHDLNGTWTLERLTDGSTVPVTVPGDNVSALLDAGVIPDPYVGMNELDVQWINREDWAFFTTFELDKADIEAKRVFLFFESLDTVAEVFVNGTGVGESDNMFLACRFDVTDAVQAGTNDLRIVFRSAEIEAEERAGSLSYPIPHTTNPVQSTHRNLVRKVQCHSGWDWGCCLMVSGIYGACRVERVDRAVLEHVYTTQRHDAGRCVVEVTAEVVAFDDFDTDFTVRLGDREASETVRLVEGDNTVCLAVEIEDPKLWWPNGMGEQCLYEMDVDIAGCTCRKRLGLRTVELVAEEDDIGKSCYFKVNGVPVFCKGANWIPVDARPALHTAETYDDLLSSAADANMNMLRVWGGGQYERDVFYDLCDEKGLLVWQDMMFACALYPADDEFLESVRREAVYQVKRLRDHACIALWCGNNENMGALKWFQPPRDNPNTYLVDYYRLYEQTLGAVLDECDPTRTYWPSSPSGGRGDYTDRWHDDSRGDMHYWDVWHSGKPFSAYFDVVPRFCSEFGFQSFPSLDAIRGYADESQFNVTSPVLEHHQRHDGGNSKIVEMFTRYFRMPERFEDFVYLSQVQQGVAIKTAVEYWRHLQPVCMGTLYWQLNDNWPVCSWASIEYGGKWKCLHYLARRFFEPLLVTAHQKDKQVSVWFVNDRNEPVNGGVAIQVLDFDGRLIKEIRKEKTVAPVSSLCIAKFDLEELTEAPERTFLHLVLECDGKTMDNDHFFTEFKKCELRKPTVQIERIAVDEWRLTTDVPAFFLTLDLPGCRGNFSDNVITLLPDVPRSLVWSGHEVPHEMSPIIQHLRGTFR